jgi:hypothetical protein
MYLAEFKSGA